VSIDVQLSDLERFGDEVDRPPSWADDVVDAIGATVPARMTREGDPSAGPPASHRDRSLDDMDVHEEDGNEVDVAAGVDDMDAAVDGLLHELTLVEAEDGGCPTIAASPTSTWAEAAELRPTWVVALVEALLRNPHLRRELVERAERRMLSGVPEPYHDPALLSAAWRFAGHPSRRGETSKWLRHLRDDMVAVLHRGNAYQHHVPGTHPENMKGWRPKGGRLVVNEAAAGSASFGHPSLLEHTPLKVVFYALRAWQRSRAVALDIEDVDIDSGMALPKPKFFDATAGSGTVEDYLRYIHGCNGTSVDLSPMSERVRQVDLRQLGFAGTARDVAWLPRFEEKAKWEPLLHVAPVDLVFFDPPSRGNPTHAELYAGSHPDADLGGLKRVDYIAACSRFVQTAANLLKPGGYIAYLVRHGVRDRQRLTEDGTLVSEMKAAFGPSVRIEREIPIQYKKRVRQVSLGTVRIPATLLTLGRAT
jgi:hypothetical protein